MPGKGLRVAASVSGVAALLLLSGCQAPPLAAYVRDEVGGPRFLVCEDAKGQDIRIDFYVGGSTAGDPIAQWVASGGEAVSSGTEFDLTNPPSGFHVSSPADAPSEYGVVLIAFGDLDSNNALVSGITAVIDMSEAEQGSWQGPNGVSGSPCAS